MEMRAVFSYELSDRKGLTASTPTASLVDAVGVGLRRLTAEYHKCAGKRAVSLPLLFLGAGRLD